jgi:hypothetical protein
MKYFFAACFVAILTLCISATIYDFHYFYGLLTK